MSQQIQEPQSLSQYKSNLLYSQAFINCFELSNPNARSTQTCVDIYTSTFSHFLNKYKAPLVQPKQSGDGEEDDE